MIFKGFFKGKRREFMFFRDFLKEKEDNLLQRVHSKRDG